MRSAQAVLTLPAVLLLALLPPLATAHGHDRPEPSGMVMGAEHGHGSLAVPPAPTEDVLPSYFRLGQFGFWMSSHIVCMMLSWVVLLPFGIMLSIARSRWSIPSQLLFHTVNGLGTFAAFVYNHATPDLYVNNAHRPLGWAVSSFAVAWTILSLFVAYGDSKKPSHPMTAENMARYDGLHQCPDHAPARYSRDSGQGSSIFTPSRQNSSDPVLQKHELPTSPVNYEDDNEEDVLESRGFLGHNKVDRLIARGVGRFASSRLFKALRFLHIVLEKLLLLLGFTAICTGFVTYGGIARAGEAFSIAAHFVKGGIFFWYGLLTLGRWMGAFTEFGWGWNIRPEYPVVARWKTRVPSAEFTESFVIWLYGASNVFLEHLGNAGEAFSAQDFEHISITMLFFGGGLLGMLLESRWVRDSTNSTVATLKTTLSSDCVPASQESEKWRQPATYRIPLNPMPGMTIMLLGMMMSGHHQSSMVSTMMHAQWGGLFTAFALARGATYIILWLKPPTSHFPSRPPSELVGAFCLTAGGLVFMLSGSDTVRAIESNGLDAVMIFTVAMGVTSLILAWELTVFAIKGWAVRRRNRRSGILVA